MNEEISLARLRRICVFWQREMRARVEWEVHGVPPTLIMQHVLCIRGGGAHVDSMLGSSTHQHFLIEGLRAASTTPLHSAPESPAPSQPDPRPHYIFGTGLLGGFHFAPTANQVSFIQLSSLPLSFISACTQKSLYISTHSQWLQRLHFRTFLW